MEKDFNTDNFEQMLREATDDFRMYPSKRVWHGIYNDLHPAKKWPSFAVLLLLVTSIMYIGVTNPDKGGQAFAKISDSNENAAQRGSLANNNEGRTKTSPLTVNPIRSNVNANTENGNTKSTPAKRQTDLYVASVKNTDAVTIQNEAGFAPQLSVVKNNSFANSEEHIENPVFKSNAFTVQQKQNPKSVIPTAPGSQEDNKRARASSDVDNPSSPFVIAPSLKGENELSLTSPASTTITSSKVAKTSLISDKDESGWMEDYAFRNMRPRDKWKGRMSYQVWVTPSLGYRRLDKTRDYSLPPTNALLTNPNAPSTTNYTLNHSSAINLELGSGIIYSASKIIRLKAGVQLNYTNYSVNAQELNHPTFTALMLTNTFTNTPVLSSRTTTIANTGGPASRFLNNSTYQVSIPMGADIKVAGNDQLKVYLGGTLQPTYILGGQSYLVSADMKNYVADESFIRKHNLNGALEAFVTYKTRSGVTLNAGPQFRYQFFSTYNNMYTYDEKLYNLGVKFGMTKTF